LREIGRHGRRDDGWNYIIINRLYGPRRIGCYRLYGIPVYTYFGNAGYSRDSGVVSMVVGFGGGEGRMSRVRDEMNHHSKEIDDFLDNHTWDLIAVCWVEKIARENNAKAHQVFSMQTTMIAASTIIRQMAGMGDEK